MIPPLLMGWGSCLPSNALKSDRLTCLYPPLDEFAALFPANLLIPKDSDDGDDWQPVTHPSGHRWAAQFAVSRFQVLAQVLVNLPLALTIAAPELFCLAKGRHHKLATVCLPQHRRQCLDVGFTVVDRGFSEFFNCPKPLIQAPN